MSEDTNQLNFNSSIPTRISTRKKIPRAFNNMAFLCTLVTPEVEEVSHFLVIKIFINFVLYWTKQ